MEKNKKAKRREIRFVITIVLVMLICVFFDLLTKILTDDEAFVVIKNFLSFISVHNIGAAYSSFAGHVIMLIIISSIMILGLVVFNIFYKGKSMFYCITMGIIFGGAAGNLFDRICFGYVRDFIKFKFFSFTCNLADIFLCVGIVLFAIYMLFLDKEWKKEK